MKKNIQIIALSLTIIACSTSRMPEVEALEYFTINPAGQGPALEIRMVKGEGHNHPLMAIWIEDENGEFVQTLFVAESIGKGIFQHGDASMGFWKPGEIRRPAALPYWSHQRGIKAIDGLYLPTPDNPVPDAYTGPTPRSSFIINTRMNQPGLTKFNVFFEINQTWDWNEYWTNNKYPENEEYKTSCQPALVYSVLIDLEDAKDEYTMNLIGRSHHSGSNGELFDDIHTLTTALHIAEQIVIRIPE